MDFFQNFLVTTYKRAKTILGVKRFALIIVYMILFLTGYIERWLGFENYQRERPEANLFSDESRVTVEGSKDASSRSSEAPQASRNSSTERKSAKPKRIGRGSGAKHRRRYIQHDESEDSEDVTETQSDISFWNRIRKEEEEDASSS